MPPRNEAGLHEETLQLERPAYGRISDYFGAWAMEEVAFEGLRDTILRTDLTEHVRAGLDEAKARKLVQRESGEQAEAAYDSSPYQLQNGIAVIELRGTLMKSESSFSESTSTVAARAAVRQAVRDPKVSAILFLIDSPGGTVAGTSDLAAEIQAASAQKPTAAYIEDLGASAAYWVASQADTISTGPTGIVGSIGTFMAVRDTSAAAEKMGLKVHVVKAGAHKGSGTPGAAVTDEHLAEYQRMVNDLNAQFVQGALVNGRGMSAEQAATIADGRVHVGEQAKALGLVDAVESMEQSVASLMERATARMSGSGLKGRTEMTEPKPATLAELKAAFPSDAAFVLKQLEAGATLADAKGAWADVLQARLDARDKELADEKAKGTARGAEPFKEGSKPAADKPTFDNPIAEFNRLKAEQVAKGHEPFKAAHLVAAKNPELHIAFMEATNPSKRAREAISEMVESFEA
jgi:signal peptide peptidase SppA